MDNHEQIPKEDAEALEKEKVKSVWQLQKEGWYDKIPVTQKQLDIIIAVCLILLALTFVILLLGFSMLRIPYPLPWALGICLVDIFPILGTGTVLLPWSLVLFLQRDTARAIGLLGIYTTITSLCRQLLVLLPVAYLLSLSGDVNKVWIAYPAAEIVSGALTCFFFLRIYRRKIKPLYS